MISYNFEYYQPTSIQEAIELYYMLDKQRKKPIYYAGGTEIITLGRLDKIVTDAIIDIKNIPECQTFEEEDQQLIIGTALSLSKIKNMQKYPLLEKIISEIADHTSRNKITLGGNICANIIYREAVLPFLLTESQAVIATREGLKETSFNKLFDQKLQLNAGELFVQVKVDIADLKLPYFTSKKRRQWGVGYPLITTAAIKKEGHIRAAFSGLYNYPFRSQKIETQLNDYNLTETERVNKAMQCVSGNILNDVHGSDEYRKFVLKNMMQDTIDALGKDGGS